MSELISMADFRASRASKVVSTEPVEPLNVNAPVSRPEDQTLVRNAKGKDVFNYGMFMRKALKTVVRSLLQEVKANGKPETADLYVSFDTRHPGVQIPDWMKTKYPEEMTIVIGAWFKDLSVGAGSFSVTLNFSDTEQHLLIPFEALTSFVDAEAEFGLKFSEPEPAKAEPQATA